jgi:hypothetical protein
VRSHNYGANPRACPPPNPSGDPWRDRAEQMTRLRDEAMASGETVVAEAAGLLAVRYDRLAKLRRGAH